MFLKLRPLVYSLLFFWSLELIVYYRHHPQGVFWILAVLVVLSLREGRISGKKWKFAILPVFFTLSSVSLLYLVTLFYEQQAFIIIASLAQYLTLFGAYRLGKYDQDQTAKGMNALSATLTVFFAFAGSYGLYLNFNVPLQFLMLVYFIVTLSVTYQQLSLTNSFDSRRVWLYSFLLGLVMAEIAWMINFWPFGYLTTGVIALILYYVLWDLVQGHFSGLLVKKRILANLFFFFLVIVFILLTSKWIPVI